jgi:hypothetical protein
LSILDVLSFVLCQAKKKDRPVRPKTGQEAESASLALSWPRDSLLDDVTSKVRID